VLTSNGYVLDESPRRLGTLGPVPDHERSDRERLWARLRRDGYLYLPGALDPELVHEFRGHYFDSFAAIGLTAPGTPPAAGVAGPSQVDPAKLRRILFQDVVPGEAYARLCAHPSIRDWYAWFFGETPVLHRRKILRCTRPGERGVGTATQAHYDLVYLREGTERVLSTWIPLGDCPVQRGGLTYLEGSHHWVLRQEQAGTLRHPATSITADLPALADEHDARWLVADYRAGDMVVHSAYTVHAALDNVDPAGIMRLSTDIRYQRSSEPIDWRWEEHWYDGDMKKWVNHRT
jgi:Phytanoyl-CoA dioxygenase (PhyH)